MAAAPARKSIIMPFKTIIDFRECARDLRQPRGVVQCGGVACDHDDASANPILFIQSRLTIGLLVSNMHLWDGRRFPPSACT
eukprot:349801-Chlamydomonas_euryale.AAC.21